DNSPAYLPADVPVPTYSDAAMRDVQNWVSTAGKSLLFIYGRRDPWGAGAYELGSAQDSFRLWVATGNHGSSVAQLAAADKAVALDAISRWSGVTAGLRNAIAGEPPGPESEVMRRGRPRR